MWFRREVLCKLAGVPVETFKSWNKRGQLPFANEDLREETHPKFTPTEALMLAVAAALGDTVGQTETARILGSGWMQLLPSDRLKQIGDPAAPQIFVGLARFDTDGEIGARLIAGSLAEIVSDPFASAAWNKNPADTERAVFERPELAASIYENRRNPKLGVPQTQRGLIDLKLTNVTRAFSELRARAADAGVELPADFLAAHGA